MQCLATKQSAPSSPPPFSHLDILFMDVLVSPLPPASSSSSREMWRGSGMGRRMARDFYTAVAGQTRSGQAEARSRGHFA